MVYLLNSRFSENQPDAWLCGGVLISQSHVLTSAACLTEVSHMYVIAGYRKYVSSKNIDKDECTRTKKQKIVKIIIPKAFNVSSWMQYDVGLGVVEKNYNFLDVSFRKVCSYEPGSILVNYNLKREATKSPVLALGWGAAYARGPGMIGDTNSQYLRQTHTLITDLTYCRKQFPRGIDYIFLCTDNNNSVVANTKEDVRFMKEEEEITSSSTLLSTTLTTTTKTTKMGRDFQEMWRCHGKQFSSNETPAECLDLDSSEPILWRRLLSLNGSVTSFNETNNTFVGEKSDVNQTISRKQGKESLGPNIEKAGKDSRKEVKNIVKVGNNSGRGKNLGKEVKNIVKVGKDSGSGRNLGKEGKNFGGICQNDHGGPLIKPDGPTEVVIGIALNSVYNKKYQCKGPFLYLSTARAGNLIKCLRSKTFASKNSKICLDKYEVKEHDVVWPTASPVRSEETVSKSCENGECGTTEQPELFNYESEEPMTVQPILVRQKKQFFNMGLRHKRPNLMNFLKTRPHFNMRMFTTRPVF
ncbi:hypothetical protein PYW07_010063 [Mythimna separata]|uniref:Peptidase S1 domain-containing protein n=1 Tax=Mythimna separata TaxID=271217 RepID=A0AAD7YIC4_MYTSE|nr:hypothetical protein PYW07_010063 [Mythimna separata]